MNNTDTLSAVKQEYVKIITYENNVEDWKCQYAILDDYFVFLGGKLGGSKVEREGQDYPDRRTMEAFSTPIVYAK